MNPWISGAGWWGQNQFSLAAYWTSLSADWVENTLCTEGLSPPKDFGLDVPRQYEASVSQGSANPLQTIPGKCGVLSRSTSAWLTDTITKMIAKKKINTARGMSFTKVLEIV